MHARQTWPDEHAFLAEDARRRRSEEVDLGATWRAAGGADTWRLAWLRDTGELYLCRADGYDGCCTDVRVLAVVAHEAALDGLLDGWRDWRYEPDGLSWLAGRLTPVAAA